MRKISLHRSDVIRKARSFGVPQHTELESNAIWDLASRFIRQNGFALEVGSWTGGSSYIIACVCATRNAKLICIDSFNGDLIKGGITKNFDFLRQNILKNLDGLPASFMVMNSTEAHKVLADRSFDFCFIDGDHTEPIISQDIKNYFTKVKPGGVYCGHDYGYMSLDKNLIYNVKKNVDKVCGKVEVIDTIWYRRIHNPLGTLLRKTMGRI